MRRITSTAIMLTLLAGCQQQPGEVAAEPAKGSGIFSKTVKSVSESCEGGGIATLDEVTVSKPFEVRKTPSASGERVKNEKASEIFDRTMYHQVDNSTRLKELCRQKSWSKVNIVEPDWLTDVVGWVPVSALRAIERDSGGQRRYVEADFLWDKDSSPYKPQLVAAVNRIVRENENCPSADASTMAKSSSRSRPGKPVFYVMCQGARPFNVWFEPEDAADKTKSFAAKRNIGQSGAVAACEQAAKLAANNPQTVEFSRFMSVSYVPYPNGNSRLISSFTAKNSFGVAGEFRIECFFESGTLTETNISENVS